MEFIKNILEMEFIKKVMQMESEDHKVVGDHFALDMLDQVCLANVLSFTSPWDVCRLSVVSPTFRSASEFGMVWDRFLPSDLESILSTSPDGSLLLKRVTSKKQLFFSLCYHPVIVDHGKKSFSLDKKSGKKCYRLSARELGIAWSDNQEYWQWIFYPGSRFAEVAELLWVCWLEIRGKINTSMLSPSTMSTAYLVLKLNYRSHGFDDQQVEVTMGFVGGETSTRSSSWDAISWWQNRNATRSIGSSAPTGVSDGYFPKRRGDGWLEIELGHFFTKEGEDEDLEMKVFDGTSHWKGGLIVEGIELRPKEDKYFPCY